MERGDEKSTEEDVDSVQIDSNVSDQIWDNHFKELVQYARENDGETNVPQIQGTLGHVSQDNVRSRKSCKCSLRHCRLSTLSGSTSKDLNEGRLMKEMNQT